MIQSGRVSVGTTSDVWNCVDAGPLCESGLS